MPFVRISIVKEVLAEEGDLKRAEIARRVTDAIAESAGVAKEVVWVAFDEVPSDEWFVAGDSVEQRWREGRR